MYELRYRPERARRENILFRRFYFKQNTGLAEVSQLLTLREAIFQGRVVRAANNASAARTQSWDYS